MSETSFFVEGIPKPQGSKTPYRRGDKIVLVEANKALPAWREQVIQAARFANPEGTQYTTPLHAEIVFILPRPKKPKFEEPGVKPDLDKLVRAVFDGLTQSGLIKDDALICTLWTEKRYGELEGAFVTISTRLAETLAQ